MYRKAARARHGEGLWKALDAAALRRFVNVLCVVNRENAARPKELYQFLRTGAEYVQFIPLVE